MNNNQHTPTPLFIHVGGCLSALQWKADGLFTSILCISYILKWIL